MNRFNSGTWKKADIRGCQLQVAERGLQNDVANEALHMCFFFFSPLDEMNDLQLEIAREKTAAVQREKATVISTPSPQETPRAKQPIFYVKKQKHCYIHAFSDGARTSQEFEGEKPRYLGKGCIRRGKGYTRIDSSKNVHYFEY